MKIKLYIGDDENSPIKVLTNFYNEINADFQGELSLKDIKKAKKQVMRFYEMLVKEELLNGADI